MAETLRERRIARYLDIGGPAMPNADAARALAVSLTTISHWRASLLAAGTITRRPDGPAPTAPCGTPSAYRRHLKRGEPVDRDCRLADARRRADARSAPDATVQVADHREKRNNMPDVPYYQHQARRYPWAERAIAAAEAVHGKPEPACACGQILSERRARLVHAKCEDCQPDPPAGSPGAPPLHFLDQDDDEPACHAAGQTTSTADPRTVTCQVCLRTTALAAELAARMVTA